MFQIQPSPKQLIRLNPVDSSLRQCPENWADFAKLCRIRSGNKMVQFLPFEYQVKLIDLMRTHPIVVVVKSRQLGITQAILSRFLQKSLLNPAYAAISFMKNQEDSSNLSRRTRVMLDSLSQYAKAESDNVGYLKIANGGSIWFKNSAKEGSRSYDSVEDFLFDEAAFSPNIESIYGSSSASSAMLEDDATKCVISTPSAKFGWYWDMLNGNNGNKDVEQICEEVSAGRLPPFYWWTDEKGTCKVVIHWKAHPIYSQRDDYLEYRQEKDGSTWDVILREYDLRFVNADVAVFDSQLVRNCAIGQWDDELDGDCDYYLGVDCSNLGDDYTAAPLLKHKGGKFSLCHIYHQKKKTSEYDIAKIGDIIDKYDPVKVGVEVTGGTGQVYLENLRKNHPGTEFIAIKTTQDSKLQMVERVILAQEMGVLEYPPNCKLIDEMLVFRRAGKQLGAISGKHDDTVMGLAFALSVSPFRIQKKSLFGD